MVQILLYFSKMTKSTRLISLLQPSPETVSLFNEVILLAEGRIIYAGPVSEVEDYFAGLGYVWYVECARETCLAIRDGADFTLHQI